MSNLKIIGTPDERTIKQMNNCLSIQEGAEGVLCADAHVGYSMPIGGVVAYDNAVTVAGVGYDIGCGNMAVKTNIRAEDVEDWEELAYAIEKNISFGVGRKAIHKVTDHPVFDRLRNSPVSHQRNLCDLAVSQLGTVGSGNHYVDLLIDTDQFVWVANHFGSRGVGHKTATGFLNLSEGRGWDERSGQGEMDTAPSLLSLASPLGSDYFECMKIAGEYAYAGREEVIKQVLKVLGNPQVLDTIHNHHNFAWEEHNKIVVRKGATPMFPNQRGFVGGSMGDICVVVKGKATTPPDALFSAMHGAGRVMSRTQAAGKQKWVKSSWKCGNYRKCNYFAPASEYRRGERNECPECGSRLHFQQRFMQRLSNGLVDWDATRESLANNGVVLIGGGADEAPQVYRPLQSVLDAHSEYLDVEYVLHPKVVLMAKPDEVDPFKD
jgi:tRNA-splicing ligase RtcB (3'-phosphate/5'-hydroxy nucleic acid ligase)